MHKALALCLVAAGLALAASDNLAPPYNGPQSGTVECSGNPIPQNGEYVFRNMPPVNLKLDFDKKIWQGTLVPGDGQTQSLILKNIGKGPQKKCMVHWTVVP